jgi:hypothetical protein
MQLDRLDYDSVKKIAENMREWDRKEIFATRWDDDVDSLVRDAMACFDFGWVASHEGEPICAIGGAPQHPGVWSVWMFATPEFDKVKYGISRFALRRMKPVLLSVANRIECRSMEGHEDAQKWLEFLGMKRESVLPYYGKDGQTFFIYSIFNPNLE